MVDDNVLPDGTTQFVRLAGPEPSGVQREMQEFADEHGFPIIGPEVGGFLRIVARMVDAESIFEMGSGFGYSASWFADALPEDGRIVLTEIDEDELDMAREYFERAGYTDRTSFELGDAVEIVDSYDGPFDVVLIDHQKHRYVEGFEKVRDKVSSGGVVIADNMMRGPVDHLDVLAGLEGEPVEGEALQGVVDYVEHVRDVPDFESTVLPLGSGIAVSVKLD